MHKEIVELLNEYTSSTARSGQCLDPPMAGFCEESLDLHALTNLFLFPFLKRFSNEARLSVGQYRPKQSGKVDQCSACYRHIWNKLSKFRSCLNMLGTRQRQLRRFTFGPKWHSAPWFFPSSFGTRRLLPTEPKPPVKSKLPNDWGFSFHELLSEAQQSPTLLCWGLSNECPARRRLGTACHLLHPPRPCGASPTAPTPSAGACGRAVAAGTRADTAAEPSVEKSQCQSQGMDFSKKRLGCAPSKLVDPSRLWCLLGIVVLSEMFVLGKFMKSRGWSCRGFNAMEPKAWIFEHYCTKCLELSKISEYQYTIVSCQDIFHTKTLACMLKPRVNSQNQRMFRYFPWQPPASWVVAGHPGATGSVSNSAQFLEEAKHCSKALSRDLEHPKSWNIYIYIYLFIYLFIYQQLEKSLGRFYFFGG